MRASIALCAAVVALALAPGCVWENVCVGGTSRVGDQCVGADVDGGSADSGGGGEDGGDAGAPDDDASIDGGPPESLVEVAVAGGHICGRTSAGRLLCWGNNTLGQLAQGDVAVHAAPREVDFGGATVLAVSGNALHTCATDSRSRLWCWGGDSGSGELGAPMAAAPYSSPVEVAGIGGVLHVAAGFANTCVTSIGGARCWGRNDRGQVANETMVDVAAPGTNARATISGDPRDLENVAEIAIADRHICFRLAASRLLFCAGENTDGALGDGTTVDSAIAVQVPLTDVTDVAAAFAQTCAVAGGEVYCWGRNDTRQTAPDDAAAMILSPHLVPGLTGATRVSVGESHACAIVSGAVRCWGSRADGRLGDGVTTGGPPAMPVEVRGIDDARELVGSILSMTCALRAGGRLSCWGQDGAALVAGGVMGPGMFLDGAEMHAEPHDVDPLR